MVNVIVVANHLLLSLRLQRHDGHLLVGDVSVKNDFKSVVCLILSISLFIYLLIGVLTYPLDDVFFVYPIYELRIGAITYSPW